jgi:hypothetical protein
MIKLLLTITFIFLATCDNASYKKCDERWANDLTLKGDKMCDGEIFMHHFENWDADQLVVIADGFATRGMSCGDITLCNPQSLNNLRKAARSEGEFWEKLGYTVQEVNVKNNEGIFQISVPYDIVITYTRATQTCVRDDVYWCNSVRWCYNYDDKKDLIHCMNELVDYIYFASEFEKAVIIRRKPQNFSFLE